MNNGVWDTIYRKRSENIILIFGPWAINWLLLDPRLITSSHVQLLIVSSDSYHYTLFSMNVLNFVPKRLKYSISSPEWKYDKKRFEISCQPRFHGHKYSRKQTLYPTSMMNSSKLASQGLCSMAVRRVSMCPSIIVICEKKNASKLRRESSNSSRLNITAIPSLAPLRRTGTPRSLYNKKLKSIRSFVNSKTFLRFFLKKPSNFK